MNREYENYKVIQLESEYPNDYKSSWDTIGVRDEYVCPECQYLGYVCSNCGGDDNGIY